MTHRMEAELRLPDPFTTDWETQRRFAVDIQRYHALREDPSRAPATLRDLDYLERRVQELEQRLDQLENR